MAKKKTEEEKPPETSSTLRFENSTIRSLKMTPKTSDSGYDIKTAIVVEAIYSQELESQLLMDAPDHHLVFDTGGNMRVGAASWPLTVSISAATIDFYEQAAARKPSDKPLLTLVGGLDSFVVSDHAGTPHVSFKITLEERHDKAAAFLAKRKVYVGEVEVTPLQMEMFGDMPEGELGQTSEATKSIFDGVSNEDDGEGYAGSDDETPAKEPKKKATAKKAASKKAASKKK